MALRLGTPTLCPSPLDLSSKPRECKLYMSLKLGTRRS